MMEWISVKDKKPTKDDSPILAVESVLHFSVQALQYKHGWDGIGWYDSSDEYGMCLNENEAFYNEYRGMLYWMPLPKLPEE